MTFLDLAVIVLFGGYSLLGWAMVPSTWRGEVPTAEQVREAAGLVTAAVVVPWGVVVLPPAAVRRSTASARLRGGMTS